jgi:hypothetical protein
LSLAYIPANIKRALLEFSRILGFELRGGEREREREREREVPKSVRVVVVLDL